MHIEASALKTRKRAPPTFTNAYAILDLRAWRWLDTMPSIPTGRFNLAATITSAGHLAVCGRPIAEPLKPPPRYDNEHIKWQQSYELCAFMIPLT